MDWRERLYDHEENPPPMAWERIREEVSAHPSGLGRKLGGMEEQPPADAWDRIRSVVGRGEQSPVGDDKAASLEKGTIRSLPSRAFAYAASIAGIGLFISIVYWYQTKGKGSSESPGNLRPYSTKMGPEAASSIVGESLLPGGSDQAADSAFPLRFTQVRKSVEPGKILLCDERGNCVAVSSKMKEMTEALGSSLNKTSAKAVQSRKWNRTLRRWQKRLQDSQYLPTPGNLFDIDQLADILSAREP